MGDRRLYILFIDDIIKASHVRDHLVKAVSGSGGVGEALRLVWKRCSTGRSFNLYKIANKIGEEAAFFAEFVAYVVGSGKEASALTESLKMGNCTKKRSIKIGHKRCSVISKLIRGDASPLQYYLDGKGRYRLADIYREYASCRLRTLLRVDADVIRPPQKSYGIEEKKLMKFLETKAGRCRERCDLSKHRDDVAKALTLYEWITT